MGRRNTRPLPCHTRKHRDPFQSVLLSVKKSIHGEQSCCLLEMAQERRLVFVLFVEFKMVSNPYHLLVIDDNM
jgi:hypothetical protein